MFHSLEKEVPGRNLQGDQHVKGRSLGTTAGKVKLIELSLALSST